MRLTANSIGYDYDAEPMTEIDEDYIDAKRDDLHDQLLQNLKALVRPLGGEAEAIKGNTFQVYKWYVDLVLSITYEVGLDHKAEVTSEDYIMGMGAKDVEVHSFAETIPYIQSFFKFASLPDEARGHILQFLSK